MLVILYSHATEEEIDNVLQMIEKLGYTGQPNPGVHRTVINVKGDIRAEDASRFMGLPGVMEVIRVTKPYRLADLEAHPDKTVIEVGDVEIGGSRPVILAGPCGVESLEQITDAAELIKDAGGDILRGGAYKPRTSPYSFQGLGVVGLRFLSEARRRTGLPIVSEAVDVETFDRVEEVVDIIQIGARNMQNYSLLKRAGRSCKPVLLKRGMWATLTELLSAAEYLMAEGNSRVILCERGVRTYNQHTRYTLDLGAIPELRRLTHLPLIVDPSHAAGKRHIVTPLAKAGLAVGADGILIEVHPDPENALVDGPQSLTPAMFRHFMKMVKRGISVTEQDSGFLDERCQTVPMASKTLTRRSPKE